MQKLLKIFEIQDGGRRHLGFSKMSFFINHRVHTTYLRIAVEFGEYQYTQSKVASIFRNFCFGLNFPFEGLFERFLGVGAPKRRQIQF